MQLWWLLGVALAKNTLASEERHSLAGWYPTTAMHHTSDASVGAQASTPVFTNMPYS